MTNVLLAPSNPKWSRAPDMSLASGASILIGLLVAAACGFALQAAHLRLAMKWADRQTSGLKYYGRTTQERKRFTRLLQLHARLLSPLLLILARTGRFRFSNGTFHYRGVAAPRGGTCSPDSFERAVRYQPRPDDVFVVTQMRCGTTWMQHVAFQTLTRGTRDLAREGVALNALSPWLESHKTVDVDDAPRIGNDPGRRIIKTHLPTSLCPFDRQAKYVCVIRDPISCFASCVDFVRSNLRGFEPDLEECVRWYLSPEMMWWSTWVDHFSGWQTRAEAEQNVLLVRFEDMKQDLKSVVREVSNFLELAPLNDFELENICTRCSFEYMQKNAEVFEMHPPHLLQMPGRLFVSGKVDRYSDIPPNVRWLIAEWCSRELMARGIPIRRFYPDLAACGERQETDNQAVTVP